MPTKAIPSNPQQVFAIPSNVSSAQQKQLKKAWYAFVENHEAPAKEIRPLFEQCLRKSALPVADALQSRMHKAEQGFSRVVKVQERCLQTQRDNAPILQNLLRLSDGFNAAKPTDASLIQETASSLPEHLLRRVHFHIFLLHTAQGKKVGDHHYGALAFNNVKFATHQDRADALRNVVLEQLAARFISVGDTYSPELMSCFGRLSTEDRHGIYYQVFLINQTNPAPDSHDGRKAFHSRHHHAETNVVRGEAVHRHLLKLLSAHTPPTVSADGKKAQEALQKELEQLKQMHTRSGKDAAAKEKHLQGQVTTLTPKLAAATTRVSDLEAANKALSDTLAEQMRKTEESLKKIQEDAAAALAAGGVAASAKEQDLERQLAQLRPIVERAQKFMAEMKQRNLALQAKLTEALRVKEETVQTLQGEMATAGSTATAQIDLLRKEIVQLQTVKDKTHRRAESVAAQLRALGETILRKDQEISSLHDTIRGLRATIVSIASTFGVSEEELLNLHQLAQDMRTALQAKTVSLTPEERNVLRRNCALMHIKSMERPDERKNPHIQSKLGLRLQFAPGFVPAELPSEPFFAAMSDHQRKKIAYKGAVASVPSKLCPTVQDHVYKQIERTLSLDTLDKLRSRTVKKFAEIRAPGTILEQLEDLDRRVIVFEGRSETPEHALPAFFGRITNSLFMSASQKIEQQRKLHDAETAEIARIQDDIDHPERRGNRSKQYEERQKVEQARHQKDADRAQALVVKLETQHRAQIDLEAAVQAAKSTGNKGLAEQHERALKRLILQDNVLFHLTDGGGSLAADILMLEYLLDHLQLKTVRSAPALRKELTFVEQMRPLLTTLLDELKDAKVFTL